MWACSGLYAFPTIFFLFFIFGAMCFNTFLFVSLILMIFVFLKYFFFFFCCKISYFVFVFNFLVVRLFWCPRILWRLWPSFLKFYVWSFFRAHIYVELVVGHKTSEWVRRFDRECVAQYFWKSCCCFWARIIANQHS